MSVGLFIDGAYVASIFPGRIDYVALRAFLERELEDVVEEAYYFDAAIDSRTQRFHNALAYPPPNGPGFRVKVYWLSKKKLFWPKSLGGAPVLHPADPTKQFELWTQKAVDVGLAYHMTRSFHQRRWSKLVLASGDADFHEPVQHFVEVENVDLYLVGASNSISHELRPYARRIFEIDQAPLVNLLKLSPTSDAPAF